MKKQSKPVPQPAEPALSKSDENIIRQFQSYLQLVITAAQIGESRQLAALPGPGMGLYYRALAKMPGNMLAEELEKPVMAILGQMTHAARMCDGLISQKHVKDPSNEAELEAVLEQLDMALANILLHVSTKARVRAEFSKSSELLAPVVVALMGHGVEAAGLIRRFQQLFPNDCPVVNGKAQPESFPDLFAWEAHGRVAALAKLADEFPAHVRTAARQMNSWPMLCYRHAYDRRSFTKLAERLELGAEYPIDVSEGARFRPDTPLVRYLEPLIERLHCLWRVVRGEQYESVTNENGRLAHLWAQWNEEEPGEEVLEVLRASRRLPPLTKNTAHAWAKKGLVPLILATDARDWNCCAEPVLQRIAKQKGVKSQATFKSRLLAAVSAAMQRLARAG